MSARHRNVVAATACATAGRRIVGAMPSAIVISPPRIATPLQHRHGFHARDPCAQQVGDPDPEPDDEDRSPPGRVHDPRGADRGGRRAQVQTRASATSALRRLHDRVRDAAREHQRDEQPQRRVGDEVRPLQSIGMATIAAGPAVKTSKDAPTTPRVRFRPRPAIFTKVISGKLGPNLTPCATPHTGARTPGQRPICEPPMRR